MPAESRYDTASRSITISRAVSGRPATASRGRLAALNTSTAPVTRTIRTPPSSSVRIGLTGEPGGIKAQGTPGSRSVRTAAHVHFPPCQAPPIRRSRSTSSDDGDAARLRIEGEIEFATAPQLRSIILDLAHEGARPVVLDLREVTFVDSAGISLLIQAKKRARGERLRPRAVVAAGKRTPRPRNQWRHRVVPLRILTHPASLLHARTPPSQRVVDREFEPDAVCPPRHLRRRPSATPAFRRARYRGRSPRLWRSAARRGGTGLPSTTTQRRWMSSCSSSTTGAERACNRAFVTSSETSNTASSTTSFGTAHVCSVSATNRRAWDGAVRSAGSAIDCTVGIYLRAAGATWEPLPNVRQPG